MERTKLRREELYERVWATPMQELSKEFGLSDVGLAKLCRRHQIPIPGRGYWARLAAGQKLTRIPLPKIEDPRLDTIEIYPRERRYAPTDLSQEKQQTPTIEVAQDRAVSHPLAKRIERSISRSKKDERGLSFRGKAGQYQSTYPARPFPEPSASSTRYSLLSKEQATPLRGQSLTTRPLK